MRAARAGQDAAEASLLDARFEELDRGDLPGADAASQFDGGLGEQLFLYGHDLYSS